MNTANTTNTTKNKKAKNNDKPSIAQRLPFKRKANRDEIIVHDMISSDPFFPKAPYEGASKEALLDYLVLFHNVVRENQRGYDISLYDPLCSYAVDQMPRTKQLSFKLFDKCTPLPQKIAADVVIIKQKVIKCTAITASVLLVKCENFAVEHLVCVNAGLIEAQTEIAIESLEANSALLRANTYEIGEILNQDSSLIAAQNDCELPYQAKSEPPTNRSLDLDVKFMPQVPEDIRSMYVHGYSILQKIVNAVLEEAVMTMFYAICRKQIRVVEFELYKRGADDQTKGQSQPASAEEFLKAFTLLDPTTLLDRTIKIIEDALMDQLLDRVIPELPLIEVSHIRKLINSVITEYLYDRYTEAFRYISDKLYREEKGKWNMRFACSEELQELKESGKTPQEYHNEFEHEFYHDIETMAKDLRTRYINAKFY